MSELIERYVHQVGRYLPEKERAEIEAELRSQIQDQLDDRFSGSPSQAEVAAALAELGDPRRMAASYSGERYLVGPALYPFMMTVLRYGWVLIPVVVIALNVVGALMSPEDSTVIGLLFGAIFSVLQSVFIFSAVVVLIFAVVERSGVEMQMKAQSFNPLELPPVDDPGAVDRLEAAFGVAMGTFVGLVGLYFWQVGGLTLRFNLSDPGEVIPVPSGWLAVTILATLGMVILHLWALRRNRWGLGSWLAQSALELAGAISLYFVLFKPVMDRLMTANPDLRTIPFLGTGAEIITLVMVGITLASNGFKLLRLWRGRGGQSAATHVTVDG
ncbi:MAG: hypothetical protein JNM70_10145 [Anaerolineae bacterium]|nr:hypothetical protein [Anaerolineae bacterium]